MKRNAFIGLSVLLLSFVQMSAYADHCFVSGVGGFCYFDSVSSNASEHAYFHCKASSSLYVKMYNHHVLVSGFKQNGTLTLTGGEVSRMLDNYYFEVMNHDGHNGPKFVAMTSLGPIKCTMGTGGRKMVFPGSFGATH